MPLELYASEVLNLRVEDIGQEISISIKDPENQSEEHIEHLRGLVQQRSTKALQDPVDAAALDARLRSLSSHQLPFLSPSSSPSSTPLADTEDDYGVDSEEEQRAYKALLDDGGVPTCSIDHQHGTNDEIHWFWDSGTGTAELFRKQLRLWTEFRQWQELVRTNHHNWDTYEREVLDIHKGAGYAKSLRIRQNRHLQTRIEDWCEFRHFFHEKLQGIVTGLVAAEQEFLLVQRELNNIRPGAGTLPPSVDEPTWSYVWEAERKKEENEIEIDAAKKSLEQLCCLNSKHTRRKTARIKEARKRLEEAQKVSKLLHGTNRARRNFGVAQLEERKWSIFLKWVDEKLPSIAINCGYRPDMATAPHNKNDPERQQSTNPKQFNRGSRSGSTELRRRQAKHQTPLCPTDQLPRNQSDKRKENNCKLKRQRSNRPTIELRRSKRLRAAAPGTKYVGEFMHTIGKVG